MVDKLVDSSIVRANMCFSELPHPVRGCIDRRCNNSFGSVVRAMGREAQLDGYGLKCSETSQEEYGSSSICFASVERIDPVQER